MKSEIFFSDFTFLDRIVKKFIEHVAKRHQRFLKTVVILKPGTS
jgi:hypothetical protein